jgi:hypothetical protein
VLSDTDDLALVTLNWSYVGTGGTSTAVIHRVVEKLFDDFQREGEVAEMK